MRIEKFHNMKTALVHVEMDVALFKIRSMRLPYFRFRVFCFDQAPDFQPCAPAVAPRIDIQQIQRIAPGFQIDLNDNPTDYFPILHDTESLGFLRAERLLDGPARNCLPRFRPELLCDRRLKCRLKLPDECFLIGSDERYMMYIFDIRFLFPCELRPPAPQSRYAYGCFACFAASRRAFRAAFRRR